MAKAWSALLTFMLTALLVSGERPAAAPSPSADCSTIMSDMIDCASYIQAGSAKARPSATCCAGLKTVLQTDAECLCEALKGAAEMGIDLDVTRAMGLPSACGQTSPPLNNCGLSPPEQSPPFNGTLIPSPPPSDEDDDEVTSMGPAPSPTTTSPSAGYMTSAVNAFVLLNTLIFTILCF